LSSDLKALPKISETKVLNLTRDLNNVLSEIQSKEKALSTSILLREACLIEMRGWTEKTTESQTQIKTFQKTLDASRDAKERCYVCGNNVDPTILKAFQTDLINAIIAEKKILLEHALGLSKLSEKISGLREKERKLIIEIDKLRTLESSLNRNIQHLQSQSSHSKRLKTAIAEKRTRIKVLEKIKLVHEQAKQFTLEEKQFVDICVNAVSRNGIPAYLCESVTPQLNNTAQHYSEVFSEGEIGIQFAASNGDVDVNICNQHGGKQTKDQSAGEMRIAAIITAFTFRDVMLPLNLLIVDEPSEGLDPANSLAFAKGLMQVLDRFQHVMIISHSTNLLSALEPDRRVEIVKTNRISRASIVTV
jgi:DNA repair exonuclease SbcCD ATPase subunit